MKQVQNFPLLVNEVTVVVMAPFSEVLSVNEVDKQILLSALVDLHAMGQRITRRFRVVGSATDFNVSRVLFIGTVTHFDGTLLHVFEDKKS